MKVVKKTMCAVESYFVMPYFALVNKLKSDKDSVKLVVQIGTGAFTYVSDELKVNSHVPDLLVRWNSENVQHADGRFKQIQKFILRVLIIADILAYIDASLLNDKKFMFDTLNCNKYAE